MNGLPGRRANHASVRTSPRHANKNPVCGIPARARLSEADWSEGWFPLMAGRRFSRTLDPKNDRLAARIREGAVRFVDGGEAELEPGSWTVIGARRYLGPFRVRWPLPLELVPECPFAGRERTGKCGVRTMILRVRRGVRLSNSGVSRKTLRLLGWRTRCSPSKRSGARNAQPARCRPVRREKTVPLERVRRTCSRHLSRGLLSSACGPAPCLPVSPFVLQPRCVVSSPCKDLAVNVRCPSARPVRRRPRRWSAILFHCSASRGAVVKPPCECVVRRLPLRAVLTSAAQGGRAPLETPPHCDPLRGVPCLFI